MTDSGKRPIPETMGRLEPRLSSGGGRATLVAEVAEAQAAADAARAEQSRAERLLADRAIPARRLEDAERSLVVANARLRAAEAGLAQRDETLGAGGGVVVSARVSRRESDHPGEYAARDVARKVG